MSNRKNVVTYSIPLVILTLLTILSPLGQQTYVAARTSDDSNSNDNSDSSSGDSNSNSNDNSDHSSDSGSGSHSGMVDKACRLINNHPGAATLLGHALGLGPAGTLAQGYCGLR
jgi:hypothetical protein